MRTAPTKVGQIHTPRVILRSPHSVFLSPPFSHKVILVPRGRAPFGQHQESRPLGQPRSNFRSMRREFVRIFSQSDCLTGLWACPDWRKVSESRTLGVGPSKLDLQRDRYSWCWPKGARPLGTRMSWRLTYRLTDKRQLWNGNRNTHAKLVHTFHNILISEAAILEVKLDLCRTFG